MTIRISSKRDGFRRCGMRHPKGPVDYPDNKFSAAEIKLLKEEPMLKVEVIKNRDKAEEEDKIKKGKGGK